MNPRPPSAAYLALLFLRDGVLPLVLRALGEALALVGLLCLLLH